MIIRKSRHTIEEYQLISALVKSVPKDTDPIMLANTVISHIERVLPQILDEISLPPKMSAEKHFVERARLRGGSGFRQPSKAERRRIGAELEREAKLDGVRLVKEQIHATYLASLGAAAATASKEPDV